MSDERRPPVVLLHGLARTHLSMAGMARALRKIRNRGSTARMSSQYSRKNRRLEVAARKVDLPAFGGPTIATSNPVLIRSAT